MRFTQGQYEQAARSDLLSYLQSNGYELVKAGCGYHMKEHDSLTISNNMWFWHSRGFGGGIIQFLTQYEQRTLPEAIAILTGQRQSDRVQHYAAPTEEKQRSEFKLPEAHSDSRRVFAYLHKTRGIDPDIISELMRRRIVYESKDYHNAVFVGKDSDGNPAFATQRSTITTLEKPFRNDVLGSDKSCPFIIEGKSDKVYVFESAIDAMSYCAIQKMSGEDWQNDTYLSLGGIAMVALEAFLKGNSNIKEIVLCLDNDEAGTKATHAMLDRLTGMGYEVTDHPPFCKDYNQDLINMQKAVEGDLEMESTL